MESIHYLLTGFNVAFSPYSLLACFAGVAVGTLIGVLPGIGPVATMSILLPLTFSMDPTTSIIMLCGIYYGAQYGGSTTSILVNIPGEIGSIITCLDGYQMARKGRAGVALGMSAIGSFIGGTLGVIGLMLLVPPLSKIAMEFGPPELFALILFGVMMVTSIDSGPRLKALVMAVLGLLVSLIGKESFTGFDRFTLGTITLIDGVGLIPVAMGLFGIAEVLENVEAMMKQEVFKTKLRDLLPKKADWLASRWAVIRGTIIGFFLGIVPGAGVSVTTFFSYWVEKRMSKHPERFGKGAIEGVAGPETANNASTSGSMIPLLSLGVPANPTMAMLLGALIIHGVQPGPFFISEYPNLFWGVIASMYIGNVMLVILNLPLIGLWVKILRVPYVLLFPLIILFCIIGAYSLNNNVYDVLIMIIFGLIGYVLRKFSYSPAPFLFAMVLGPMMETSFRQSMAIAQGNPAIFVQRPLSAIFLAALVAVILFFGIIGQRKKKQKIETALRRIE